MPNTREYDEQTLLETRMRLNEFKPGDHQSAYKRLVALGEGAEPFDRSVGICCDLDHTVFEGGCGYRYCMHLFRLMGLDDAYPLGELSNRDEWIDVQGYARRQLCLDMAECIRQQFLG